MQAFASGQAIDPVYLGLAAIMVVGALCLWVLRNAIAAKDAGDPLRGLFDSSTFDTRLDSVVTRHVSRRPRRTIKLHGQRAQMARLRQVWEIDTRSEAIEKVARVIRAGKGQAPAQVHIIEEQSAATESEWEEVKLLPPPSKAA